MTAHKHAALMLQYAQDAAETARPWDLWQKQTGFGFEDLGGHPHWDNCSVYRRKPRTIRIGEFDVPEPLRVAPLEGQELWTVHLSISAGVSVNYWRGENWQLYCLSSGILHLTKEAAELHAKALLSFTKVAA